MKKVFALLAVAAVMTSCNSEGEKTETPAADTTKVEAPAAAAVIDSAANAMKAVADSGAAKIADTVKKAAEGAVEKAKEAVKH